MSNVRTARFTISGDNGKVQDVGYRIFIFTKLNGYGLDVAKPINIPGDGVQVTVSGDEEIIKNAINELRKEKPPVKKVGKIRVSDPEFGDYEFKKFTNKEIQILTLDQLGKGVPAILNMNEVVSNLDNKYHNISKTLNYQLIGISVLVVLALVFGIFLVLK